MLVLGIETTCDETAAAVVERDGNGQGRILSNVVLSQVGEHAAFGGVVPEIAARAHVEALDRIIAKALVDAGKIFRDLDGVAAAAGPGLIGGVIVGLTTAKAIALVNGKPLMAINHLEAHALTARLTSATPFPYCLFLASGGHTQIVAVRGVGDYVLLGTTLDDAIGEAFDKTAKLLGLGYPGGPQVEKEAAHGNAGAVRAAAADAGPRRAGFLAVGAEDRAAARSGEDRAAQRPGRCRSVRVVPAGGGRGDPGPAARRHEAVPQALRRADRAGRRRRRRRQRGDPQGAAAGRLRGRHQARGAAGRALHRQRRDDRLGRRRAAGARPHRSARLRAARALAAGRGRRAAARAVARSRAHERMAFDRIAVLGGGAWGTALANVDGARRAHRHAVGARGRQRRAARAEAREPVPARRAHRGIDRGDARSRRKPRAPTQSCWWCRRRRCAPSSRRWARRSRRARRSSPAPRASSTAPANS